MRRNRFYSSMLAGLACVVALSTTAASSGDAESETQPATPPSPVNEFHFVDELPGINILYMREDYEFVESISQQFRRTHGFGELSLSDDSRSLTISWAGQPPPALTTAVAEAPDGLRVVVEQAMLSREARDRALEAVEQARARHSLPIMGMYTTTDALVLEVPLEVTTALRDADPDVERAIESVTDSTGGVQVRLVPAGKPNLASRLVHAGPFVGGMIFNSSPTGACTTGFAANALQGSSGAVVPAILTAAHCTEQSVNYVYTDATSREIGSRLHMPQPGHPVINDVPTMPDASVIRSVDSGVAAAVYIGGLTSPNAIPVRGVVSTAPVGSSLCYSGAYSAGVSCGHEVLATDYFWLPAPGSSFYYGPSLRTKHSGGLYTVGQGDSGGPVFGAALEDSRPVAIAAGIISGIDIGPESENTTCQGVVDPNRLCSDLAMSTPIGAAYSKMPVSVAQWTGSW